MIIWTFLTPGKSPHLWRFNRKATLAKMGSRIKPFKRLAWRISNAAHRCCWIIWWNKKMGGNERQISCLSIYLKMFISYISENLQIVYIVHTSYVLWKELGGFSIPVRNKSLSMRCFHCLNVAKLHVSTKETCKTYPMEKSKNNRYRMVSIT